MSLKKSREEKDPAKLKVLIRRTAIQKRVREVAQQITKDFKGERVHLIGVLKGACFFLSDLAREINLETSFDFIAVSSYGRGKESFRPGPRAERSRQQHRGAQRDRR